MTTVRTVAILAGLAVGCYGAVLLAGFPTETLVRMGIWAAAGVAIQDLVFAPASTALVHVVGATVPRPWRSAVAVAAMLSVTVALLAIPVYNRSGSGFGNTTVLDRDYHAGFWLLQAGIGGTLIIVLAARSRCGTELFGRTLGRFGILSSAAAGRRRQADSATYNDRMARASAAQQPARAGKGLPSTRRGRQTRAAIIEAAATLMYDNGVHATSLEEVLTASGAGKSQLYHYFDDKADLVQAVIARQLDRVLASQPSLNHIDSFAGIEAWVTEILDLHSAPGGPFACPLGTVAAELKNDDAFRPSLAAAFRQWEGRLARGLVTMQERGELVRRADPAALATMTIAALQGGMLLARVHGDVSPLRDALAAAVAHLRMYVTAQ